VIALAAVVSTHEHPAQADAAIVDPFEGPRRATLRGEAVGASYNRRKRRTLGTRCSQVTEQNQVVPVDRFIRRLVTQNRFNFA